MEWILWDWLQKGADYQNGTFVSYLLKKKGGRTPRHWNKQHFGNKSPVLPADQFLRLNVVAFFSIYFLFMYLFEK